MPLRIIIVGATYYWVGRHHDRIGHKTDKVTERPAKIHSHAPTIGDKHD
jgi:hypothetical protein